MQRDDGNGGTDDNKETIVRKEARRDVHNGKEIGLDDDI